MSKEYMDFPFEVKSEDVLEDGSFKGYASTFGGEPDSYGDVIVRGAFTESLAKGGRNGFGISLLWQHNPAMPIGVPTILQEDRKGLYIEGKLALRTQLGAEVHELLKIKAVQGMSIGYDTTEIKEPNDEQKKLGIKRFLKGINLWEVSLATFPANRNARVTGVKSAIEQAQNERELEAALRDAGLSASVAKYLVSLCKGSLRDAEPEKQDVLSALFEQLKSINAEMLN